jgi:hypothetical protein
MMTAFAAFAGILVGLALTLFCLAIFQMPLPALPFSIALGLIMTLCTRFLLEPHITSLATRGVFY